MKPTPDDIAITVSLIRAGEWIDPAETPAGGHADAGEFAGDGIADSPGVAMALAWICWHDNDALCRGYVEPDWVPFEVPDDWRF
jgi:hypothetical protein